MGGHEDMEMDMEMVRVDSSCMKFGFGWINTYTAVSEGCRTSEGEVLLGLKMTAILVKPPWSLFSHSSDTV